MRLERARGARRSAVQGAGIALIAALLAACGGGGGGGGASGGGGAGNTGTGGGTGTLGPGGGLGTCRATQDTSATGFTLGVCDNRTSSAGSEQNDVGFKDIVDAAAIVSIVDYAAKAYTLNLPSPIGSPVALSAATQEDRCLNRLGNAVGLALQEPVNATTGQPRSAILSFTQATTGTAANDPVCPSRPGQSAQLPLTKIDFGTWERYVGAAELYYGGWYTPRAGNAASRPTADVAFDGAGAGVAGSGGLSAGYLFTAISSFGTSATVRNVSYSAATGKLTGTLSNFDYSRSGQAIPANATLTSATFTATVEANGRFSGTLAGTGTLTPAGQSSLSATVAGLVEGVVVGNPTSGFELAARYQASLTGAGLTAPSARAAGSFAIAQ